MKKSLIRQLSNNNKKQKSRKHFKIMRLQSLDIMIDSHLIKIKGKNNKRAQQVLLPSLPKSRKTKFNTLKDQSIQQQQVEHIQKYKRSLDYQQATKQQRLKKQARSFVQRLKKQKQKFQGYVFKKKQYELDQRNQLENNLRKIAYLQKIEITKQRRRKAEQNMKIFQQRIQSRVRQKARTLRNHARTSTEASAAINDKQQSNKKLEDDLLNNERSKTLQRQI